MTSKKQKQNKATPVYTLEDFENDFPDEETCIEWLRNYLYPDGICCESCNKVTPHHFISSRKSYSCQECGHHVHVTANTIFYRSSTPLTTWFYTLYLIAQTQGSISAKEIERQIGVTYKTAWRMRKLIFSQLDK